MKKKQSRRSGQWIAGSISKAMIIISLIMSGNANECRREKNKTKKKNDWSANGRKQLPGNVENLIVYWRIGRQRTKRVSPVALLLQKYFMVNVWRALADDRNRLINAYEWYIHNNNKKCTNCFHTKGVREQIEFYFYVSEAIYFDKILCDCTNQSMGCTFCNPLVRLSARIHTSFWQMRNLINIISIAWNMSIEFTTKNKCRPRLRNVSRFPSISRVKKSKILISF